MSLNTQNKEFLFLQFASCISGLFITVFCFSLKSNPRINPVNHQAINKILALGIFLVATHLTKAYLSYYFLERNLETLSEFIKKFMVFWKNYYAVNFSFLCVSIISECRKYISNKTSKRILGIANINPIYCILLSLSITTPIFTIPVVYNFALGKYTMEMNYNKLLLVDFIVNDFWILLSSLFGLFVVVLILIDSNQNKSDISVSLKEKSEPVLLISKLELEINTTNYDSEFELNDSSPLCKTKSNLNKNNVLMIAVCWMMVLMFSFTLPLLYKWFEILGFKRFLPNSLELFIVFLSEMKGILCLQALLYTPLN
ncbi:hypothetical protein BB559_005189 [Furculomyces boomerangus]|uniref:Uncharacterized protein n=1 Tax=Furculomyces boomerangus TaxID=61424 RepID=A0A2T9Y7I0_9FUNG|nr:hypothetical protein BB559_005640 [Furculomyces boomerangus]PVU89215.1 hypothetical protein BB559_005189 [Furculomyces boomerangus]